MYIVRKVRNMSPELQPMAVQYTGHVIQMEIFHNNLKVITLNQQNKPSFIFLSRHILLIIFFYKLLRLCIRGTVSLIFCDPPCKDSNSRFTTIPLNPLSAFLSLKVFNSDNF